MADDRRVIKGALDRGQQFYKDFQEFRKRQESDEDNAIEVDANFKIDSEFLKQFSDAVDKFGTYTREIKNTFSAQAQAYGAGHLYGEGGASEHGRPSSHSSAPGGPKGPEDTSWTRVQPTGAGVANWEGTWNPRKFISSRKDLMERQAIDLQVREAGVSPGASVPSDKIDSIERKRDEAIAAARGGGELSPWEVVARTQPGVGEKMRLPAFGEVQLDEKVGILSNYLLGQAVRRRDKAHTFAEGDPKREELENSAERFGNIGMGSRYAADRLAPFVTGYRDIKQIATRAGFSMPTEPGIKAGYEPGSSVDFLGMGFRLPNFSEDGATAEGLRSNFEALKLGMQSGISNKQANIIGTTLRRDGFTGSTASEMNDYVGQLVKEGWDPEMAASMLGKGVRHGTSGIDEMKEAMDGLGDVARTSRMSVDALAQGIDEFAETSQKAGGEYAKAFQTGTTMAQSTGLAPQVLNKAMGNPMVQLAGAQMLGNLWDPSLTQGVLDDNPDLQVAALYQGLDHYQTIYGAAATESEVKDPLTGEKRMVKTDLAKAAIARDMGLSTEAVTRLMENRDKMTEASGILSNLNTVEAAAQHDGEGAYAALDALERRAIDNIAPEAGTEAREKFDKEIKASRGKKGSDRAKAISEAVSSTIQAQIDEKGSSDSEVKLKVEASPLLKKFFNFETEDDAKRAKNEGKGKDPWKSGTKSPSIWDTISGVTQSALGGIG